VIVTRFAPSPTGRLHLGHAFSALFAERAARGSGGRFLLRLEDIDLGRCRPEFARGITEDLAWLGVRWDGAVRVQSEHFNDYRSALDRLRERGLLYPCFCTRKEIANEIARAGVAPQASELGADGPRYPGTCRELSAARRRQYEAEGRRPSLRLRVPDERVVSFTDEIVGPLSQHVQEAVGDFIVRRSDGIFAYQFAVVVDDGLMRINQVVRGVDLLSSTARQILLFELLGLPVPSFAHVPLWLDRNGHRLSKRIQSEGLAPLRSAGLTPGEVIGQLAASCGLSEPGEAIDALKLVQRYAGSRCDIMRTKLSNQ